MKTVDLRQEIKRYEDIYNKSTYLLDILEDNPDIVREQYDCYYTTSRDNPIIVRPKERKEWQIREQLEDDNRAFKHAIGVLKQQLKDQTNAKY